VKGNDVENPNEDDDDGLILILLRRPKEAAHLLPLLLESHRSLPAKGVPHDEAEVALERR